jgi:hypothetical protein
MSDESRIEIRAHRGLFRTGWRIRRIPWFGWDVTKFWAGGVPIKPVLFFVAAVAAMALASHILPLSLIPLVGTRSFRYVGIPLAIGLLSRNPPPDERPTLAYMAAMIGRAVRLPRRSGWTRISGPLAVRWDGSSSSLKRARITGACKVTFTVPVSVDMRHNRLVVRPGGEPQTVTLGASPPERYGQTRLEIRP